MWVLLSHVFSAVGGTILLFFMMLCSPIDVIVLLFLLLLLVFIISDVSFFKLCLQVGTELLIYRGTRAQLENLCNNNRTCYYQF